MPSGRKASDMSMNQSTKLSQILNTQPPQVSANSWNIVNATTGEQIANKQSYGCAEIASLTKIMTAYVSIQIAEQLGYNESCIFIKVPRLSSWIGGTSAFLKCEDVLTLKDLLFAMMLPSGNDAAMAISNWGGIALTQLANQKREDMSSRANSNNRSRSNKSRQTPTIFKMAGSKSQKSGILLSDYEFNQTMKIQVFEDEKDELHIETDQILSDDDVCYNIQKFVKEMNNQSIKLGMKDTQFSNPHGLSHKGNRSTVQDISRLSTHYLSNETLKTVVRTREYSTISFKGVKYTWYNTNILLKNQNCFGLKTGFTPNAGACIAVLYDLIQNDQKRQSSIFSSSQWCRRNDLEGYIVLTFTKQKIIVLLGARDQSKRFQEAEKLFYWVDSCYKQVLHQETLIIERPITINPQNMRGSFHIRNKDSSMTENYLRQISQTKPQEKDMSPQQIKTFSIRRVQLLLSRTNRKRLST